MSGYKLVQHAAHDYYSGAPLHDLEQWDSLEGPGRPSDVPRAAQYLCGYLDANRVQHWLWTRSIKPSGDKCPRCR